MASKLMWPREGSLVVGPRDPGHEPGFVPGRELLCLLPRQLRSFHIDFVNPIPKIEFPENNSRSAEGVGFDNVATDLQKIGVNLSMMSGRLRTRTSLQFCLLQ